MRCGSIYGSSALTRAADEGNLFGAYVAEHGLTCAALNFDPELEWDFFRAYPQTPLFGASRHFPDAASDFPASIAGRVRNSPLSRLPEVAVGDFLFVTNLPSLHRIAELRSYFCCTSMPICAVTHALCYEDIALSYTGAVLSALPCDVLITPSASGRTALGRILESAVDRLRRSGVLAATTPTIIDIPYGVEVPPPFPSHKQLARMVFKIPDNAFVILSVGRLTENYKADLDILLTGTYCMQQRERIFLILAGQAPDRRYIRHLHGRLSELGMSGRYLIIENFSQHLKSSLFAAADLFVSVADSIQETFGLTILEAMSHGLPVIGTDWSGYRDLIVHGDTGFLLRTTWCSDAGTTASMMASIASPYETAHYLAQHTIVDVQQLTGFLTLLAGNPQMACQMGRAARDRVIASYSWEVSARSFLATWREQCRIAAEMAAVPASFCDLNYHFGHYATRALQYSDIVSTADTGLDIEAIYAQWNLSNVECYDELESILGELSCPMSVKELRDRGHSLEMIMWLVKKGICRLQQDTSCNSQSTLVEPHYSKDGAKSEAG